nr:hypothetical protein CFP56_11191 [Quercus suber]
MGPFCRRVVGVWHREMGKGIGRARVRGDRDRSVDVGAVEQLHQGLKRRLGIRFRCGESLYAVMMGRNLTSNDIVGQYSDHECSSITGRRRYRDY